MNVSMQIVRDLCSNFLLRPLNRYILWFWGILSLTLLSWFFVYNPWNSHLNVQLKKLSNEQAIYLLLKKNYSIREQKSSATNSQLLTQISDQLKNKALEDFPYKIHQVSSKEIEVIFTQVPYDALISWMWSLSNNQQVFFKKIDLQITPTPGLVQANIFMVIG